MYSEYYNYTESLLHVFYFIRFQLLHASVDSVEKRLSGSGGVVMIRCKDFTRLALDIPTAEDCLNVASSVEALSNIG